MKNEIIDKMSNLIAAAFGLIAALAWNGAIKAIFQKIFGSPDNIGPMLIYAVTVTVIGVVLVVWMGKISARAKGK